MNHGGDRAGAGRKPGSRALVMRSKAEAILATVNEEKIWQRLLRCRNERIVLDAMKYLTDRRDGKATQAVDLDVAGELSVSERLESALKRIGEM
jgi:hypothetical protein